MMRAVDPIRFPLQGSHLIEASAGTGKTWTIATLYLRLVLGHGEHDTRPARALNPPEILVVTFTDAATQELRDRIRARLTEAQHAFCLSTAQIEAGFSGDEVLKTLVLSYDEPHRPACARRLQLAAEWMDEAAVSTIHGWCQRMLRQHAFDSGSLFNQTLESNLDDAKIEAVRDYWRHFFHVCESPRVIDALIKRWPDPDVMFNEINPVLPYSDTLEEGVSPQEAFARLLDKEAQVRSRHEAQWPEWIDTLGTRIEALKAAKILDGNKTRKTSVESWLQKLKDWRDTPAQAFPDVGADAFERFSAVGLSEKTNEKNKGYVIDVLPVDVALSELAREYLAAQEAREQALHAIKRHAVRWVAERLAGYKHRQAVMAFDDLISMLHRALVRPGAESLRARIRAAFPAVLIDEFQDTDAQQYGIFDAIYRVADNAADTSLVLIGDPKQAIYSFRGADIHTYLAARQHCDDRLHGLPRNHRSTQAAVDAVNRLFLHGDAGEQGAFLFKCGDHNPLPFHPVLAQGRTDGFRTPAGDAWLPGLRFEVIDGNALSKTDYRQRAAAQCASAIVAILNDTSAQFHDSVSGLCRAPAAGDMAVLVNTGFEADTVRAALAQRGVRSVYLSGRDSVLATDEAGMMLQLLRAVASPGSASALRRVLAGPLFGLPVESLQCLMNDDIAIDAIAVHFRSYHECWQRQGVLPMVRRVLHEWNVAARLLGNTLPGGGERSLTNLLHLAEILQADATLLDGEHALIRHLEDERQAALDANGRDESRQLRLESDDRLVKVVTVHKSKGLEYPLVFLPFACDCRPVDAKSRHVRVPDADGQLVVRFDMTEDAIAAAERERLAEDIRKLYVALTRARHFTWVCLAATNEMPKTALAHVLRLAGDAAQMPLRDAVATLAAPAVIDVVNAVVSDNVAVEHTDGMANGFSFASATRYIDDGWRFSSYSSLQKNDANRDDNGDTAHDENFADRSSEDPVLPVTMVRAKRQGHHEFPGGRESGTVIHDVLEWAFKQGVASVVEQPARLRAHALSVASRHGLGTHGELLSDWVLAILTTPLPVAGCELRLCELTVTQAEPEFWIETRHVDLQRVDALVCRHTLNAASRQSLLPQMLNGMLKGFIDLLFEYQGRYYVLDYKSNTLGTQGSDYTPEAMRDAILEKRYEMQYVLYLLALHRLLKARLPDYDYDRHIGGALYLFLRGINGDAKGVHIERPSRELIGQLDTMFAGAEEEV